MMSPPRMSRSSMVGLLGVVGSISVRRTDSPGGAACQRGLESALAMRRSLGNPQGRLRWLTRGDDSQRAFAFLGGVTTALVCDQLKSGVVIRCRYSPGSSAPTRNFAQHYGTVILPARPAKARDKAKVEVAVQRAAVRPCDSS